jgi:hypothetical protein
MTETTNTGEVQIAETVRLPLWKNCIDEMRKQGIAYGQTFHAEFFETHLRTKRDSITFGLSISEIRRELEKDGYYLSGRGGKGDQWQILPPESNSNVMECYQRAAVDALKRGVILGTATRLDTLSEDQRRKHEAVLQRLAIRAALVSRAGRVERVLKQSAPELLTK